MIRVLFWNIERGARSRRKGGKYEPLIAEALVAHNADVVILAEYRATNEAIKKLLANHYAYALDSGMKRLELGITVFSRTPIADDDSVDDALRLRFQTFRLTDYDVTVAALHIPLEKQQHVDEVSHKQETFRALPEAHAIWQALFDFAASRSSSRCVLIGDLNTGQLGLDEFDAAFECKTCRKRFHDLPGLGFIDAWRKFHGLERERSWQKRHEERGFAIESGYRVDHAFISESLETQVQRCDYSHDERCKQYLSDHSLLIIDLDLQRQRDLSDNSG